MSRSTSHHHITSARSCRCSSQSSSLSGYNAELINANSNHLLVGVQYKPQLVPTTTLVAECAVRRQINEAKETMSKLKSMSDHKDQLILELAEEPKSSRSCHCVKACLIHSLEKSNLQLKKELSLVQGELALTSKELKDAKTRQRTQDEYIMLLKKEITELKSKQQHQHSDHFIVLKPDNTELLALRDENATLRVKVTELEAKLDQEKKDRKDSEDALEQRIKTLVEQLEMITAERDSISTERGRLEAELNVLKLENQNNHTTIEGLVKDVHRLESELSAANALRVLQEQQMQVYLDQIAQLATENQQLKGQVQSLVDSLSLKDTLIQKLQIEEASFASFKQRLAVLLNTESNETCIEDKIKQLNELSTSLSLSVSKLEASLSEEIKLRVELEKKLKDLEAEKARLLGVEADQKLKIELMCQQLYKLDQMSSKRCELEKDLCYKSAMVKRLKYKMEKLFELSKKLRLENQSLKELLEMNCVVYSKSKHLDTTSCCCCTTSKSTTTCLELDCFDFTNEYNEFESFLSSIKCSDA